jgi:hypothetical protein
VKKNKWCFKSWKNMGEEFWCSFKLGEKQNWCINTAHILGGLLEASKCNWRLRMIFNSDLFYLLDNNNT